MNKLLITLLVLTSAGCNQQEFELLLGSDNLNVDDPTPDTCEISDLQLNGVHAADAQKTNYFCYFDDDDSVFAFAVRTDTGAYVRFGNDPEIFVRWRRSESPCELTFYAHPAGSDLYNLTNLDLNADNTVNAGSLSNLSNGTTRTFSDCYYDLTPGF